ncbi:centrosomal protein of 89 kDa isoform X2 [Periophthalmus magnuspinnatus]|uniref:centrosomal protein of 89 kDa isoform X2 n=1 Tax=Periophthalmus magnuspinnatus TaxID=409849 RepID=UPI002436CF21|nr:centrosomal protein of 89 kDa isoform X2 [Periophthalmus magnuspinnatus]
MLKFSFRRDREKDFKHISHGLIPAASIAPKPAVPRTPPPRSPDPSPERPRSALAAAILSSSLTGQTWALPPIRPRFFTESDPSDSVNYEPNSAEQFQRERWSEDVPSSEHSEGELDDQDGLKEMNEIEEHIYQTLDTGGQREIVEPVYAFPIKDKAAAQQLTETSGEAPAFDCKEEPNVQSPKSSHKSFKKSSSKKNNVGYQLGQTSDSLSQPSEDLLSRHSTHVSTVISKPHMEGQTNVDEKHQIDQTRQPERSPPEIIHHQSSLNPWDRRQDLNCQPELQNLRKHAQELVDENDTLKMTVHRLNVELSRYQVRFRPLSKEESAKISGLPMTESPPPWLLDMKYLSPLLLAYEDRMNEKDALLKTTEEEMKRLRIHVEEVIKENEKLHDDIAKIGGVTQTDWQQLQEQAFLVLQENQVLIEQLEAENVKNKESQSKHHSKVSKLAKQLMFCEAEKQRLEDELEASKGEAQKNKRNAQALQDRLKDSVTWNEHCNITGKLRWQLEQQDNKNKSNIEELLLKISHLEEQNRNLNLDKENLSAAIKRLQMELEMSKQAYRKAEGRLSLLKHQKAESVLKEENTRHYLGAVVSVAEHISLERDQLLHMASVLEQEKQGFICNLLNGTVRLGKLQEQVKVYRRQASSRLAVLERAAEGSVASHRREILHLQRLLGERQEAEERLLQSKRVVEEELEVVWQAATRDNQQIRELPASSRLTFGHKWTSGATDGTITSSQRQLT